MRRAFCDAMVERARNVPLYFLTGDLGFGALEPLRDILGARFINCGVAEQNMIGVAAGLSRSGHEVWVYSIGPFCYARPFEQIRNDIALNGCPVRLVANGGGYAYGVMGPTHHALEDYGVLLTLPQMTVYVPARDADVRTCVHEMGTRPEPAYMRLGLDEFGPAEIDAVFQPWRRLTHGDGPVVVTCGAIAGLVYRISTTHSSRPDVWLVSRLPIAAESIPRELLETVAAGPGLIVIEEHSRHGGVAGMLAQTLLTRGVPVKSFRHLCATEYRSGRYGSQSFHRCEAGLDEDAIRQALEGVPH